MADFWEDLDLSHVAPLLTVGGALLIYIVSEVVKARRERVERRRVSIERWVKAISTYCSLMYTVTPMSGVAQAEAERVHRLANEALSDADINVIRLSFRPSEQVVAAWLELELSSIRASIGSGRATENEYVHRPAHVARLLRQWHFGRPGQRFRLKSIHFAPRVSLIRVYEGHIYGYQHMATKYHLSQFMNPFPHRLRHRVQLVLAAMGRDEERHAALRLALNPAESALARVVSLTYWQQHLLPMRSWKWRQYGLAHIHERPARALYDFLARRRPWLERRLWAPEPPPDIREF